MNDESIVLAILRPEGEKNELYKMDKNKARKILKEEPTADNIIKLLGGKKIL